jgi:5-methylcytosine-specific restriction endonuclease McrA
MKTKICTKCGKRRPVAKFKRRWKRITLESWCNNCRTIYDRTRPYGRWKRLASNLRLRYGVNFRYTTLRDQLGEPDTCYLCGEPIVDRPELDHVIPRSRGGRTSLLNLRWTHHTCNRGKHDMLLHEFLDVVEKILRQHRRPLFLASA